MESLSRAGASTAATVIWALAAVCVLGAVNEARILTTTRESLALATAAKPPSIVVTEVPLSKMEYEAVAKRVKDRQPGLNIAVDPSGKGIITESSDIAAYYQWLISIYDIMSAAPEARWATVEMSIRIARSSSRAGYCA
jgi:hypothetical protein